MNDDVAFMTFMNIDQLFHCALPNLKYSQISVLQSDLVTGVTVVHAYSGQRLSRFDA